jgi:hypothetical protein
MHAMEIAHAEMRDAALEPAAVVGRRPQSVRPLRRVVELHRHINAAD